jgi:site-specific recombinase XerD
LALSAAELRLPILVPNPAHSQFIARESSDPHEETLSLPAARARQLLNVSAGDSILAHRDRAIVKLYLYTGIRLATGCSLLVEDFRQEGEEATLRLREKGDKRRTIGLHYAAAQAIHEYLQSAELTSGPLFRPRRHSHTEELAATAREPRTMWTILKDYLSKLPNALRERELPDGNKVMECVYTPHSLRATAATLLLDSGVDIMEVKELLGHRHVTPLRFTTNAGAPPARARRTRCRCKNCARCISKPFHKSRTSGARIGGANAFLAESLLNERPARDRTCAS